MNQIHKNKHIFVIAIVLAYISWLVEVVIFALRRPSFQIEPQSLATLGGHAAIFLCVTIIGLALNRALARKKNEIVQRPYRWLAYFQVVLGITSLAIWTYAESSILLKTYRTWIALGVVLVLGAISVRAFWIKKLTDADGLVFGVTAWCFGIGAARLPRQLLLHAYNFRWEQFAYTAIEGIILVLVLATIIWLVRGLLRQHIATTRLGLLLAAISLLLLATISSSNLKKETTATPPDIDIFLVVLDSLRADHVNERDMPFLYRNSADGVRYIEAYAPSIMTFASMPALTTAKVEDQAERVALAHLFSNKGFETHLISDYPSTTLSSSPAASWNTIASQSPWQTHRLLNLPEYLLGFFTLDPDLIDGLGRANFPFDSEGPMSYLERLFKKHPDPGFFLIHLSVPHQPYNAPPYQSKSLQEVSPEQTIQMNERFRLEKGQGEDIDVLGRKLLYRHAVRAADEVVEQLLHQIHLRAKERPFFLVITSDHGEALGENGPVGHGRSLRKEAYHVPLVLLGQGIPSNRVVDVPTSTRVVPDMLIRAGSQNGERLKEGPILAVQPPRPIIVWFERGTVIQDGEWRLIFTTSEHVLNRPKSWAHRQQVELYNVSTDPDEVHSIASENPQVVQKLLKLMSQSQSVPQSTKQVINEYLAVRTNQEVTDGNPTEN